MIILKDTKNQGFTVYRSQDIEGRNIKKTTKWAKNDRKPEFPRVDILLMVAQNLIIHIIF